ncbi:hypothetical protein NL676_008768 [Syzygium grande]|nr:hypothetical protein NL676_008768 [Syzygium grande]
MKDLCILEQIAAINYSSFAAADSLLPFHIESRFHKLKLYAVSKPQTMLQSSSNCKTESTGRLGLTRKRSQREMGTICRLPIRGFVHGGRNFLATEAESKQEIVSEIHHEVRSSLFTDGLFLFMEEAEVEATIAVAPEEGRLLLVLAEEANTKEAGRRLRGQRSKLRRG